MKKASTWSPSDIQRSTPLPVKVTCQLDCRNAQRLDSIAAEAECSRAEMARRLLLAVIEDDAAEHAQGPQA